MPMQPDAIQSKGSLDRLDTNVNTKHNIVTTTNSRGESSMTELVVRAASLCNKVIVEKCGMCTVYCDEQIQYEALAQDFHNTTQTSIFDLYHQEVETARNFLFDEDSVVDSIIERA